MSLPITLLSRQNTRLFITQPFWPVILDLKHKIDFLEGQTCRLNIEVPDERRPRKVEHGENEVVLPADVRDGLMGKI
jgi:hypothetical protein